jgi:hypothetical protein
MRSESARGGEGKRGPPVSGRPGACPGVFYGIVTVAVLGVPSAD